MHLRPVCLLGTAQGQGVALHCSSLLECLQASCHAGGATVPLLCGCTAPLPLPLPPQGSQGPLSGLCVCGFQGRVGRKGLPPQDSQASWLTWEMMLGSEGGGECSLEEGAQGQEGRPSWKGLLGSWRSGMGQKALEKKPARGEEAGEMGVSNGGWSIGRLSST